MTDPIQVLAHDHADINQRVLALARQLEQSAPPSELVEPLDALRDLLFLHFAREEEGLFPFVAEVAPDLGPRVQQMEIAHDTICGALARMCHLASSDGALATIVSLFERFQVLYADHASAEALLLSSLDQRIDPSQREHLASLVEGL
jgi:iron-sulfur cluster repair protein YtfE (RIC family)